MSDSIKHECGIALIRLLKPLSYYKEKYGSSLYGMDKMYLMLEKQHNRGQDGAGFACIKNILPIPGLDGGHLLFVLYEMVSRRKPSDVFLERAQEVGMIILILLMVFAFGNDLMRLFR